MDKIISDLKAYYQDIRPDDRWKITLFVLAGFCVFYYFDTTFEGFIRLVIWIPLAISTYYWRKPSNLRILPALTKLKIHRPTVFYLEASVFLLIIFLALLPLLTYLR